MQKLQGIGKHGLQSPKSRCLCSILFVVKTRLHHFNIPVTEFLPDKVIDFLYCNSQLIFIQIFCNILCQCVDLGENPLVCTGKGGKVNLCRNLCFFQVHHNKSGRVPYLIGKVSACLYSFPVETHIISGRISGHQSQTQGISAVFVNNLKRVNTVSKGFTHLATLGISYQTMNEYMVERCLSGLFKA